MTAEQTSLVAVDKNKLASLAHRWTEALSILADLPCSSAAEEEWWVGRLDAAQMELKSIEAEREELVRPILRDKKLVDAAFKEATAPLEKAKDLIKQKLAARQETLRAAQVAVQEAARLAAVAGDHAACAQALAAIPETHSVDGAKTQWVWEPAVVDAAAVPREYLAVDEKKLAAYAKAFAKSESIPAVPGVSFRRAARMSAKGGK